MGKYDESAAAKNAPRRSGRPECVVNVSDVPAEPYERAVDGIAGAARDIGEAAGTRLIGIDVTEIPPGKKSSHLHHHSRKEEFFYVLSGKCRLKLGEAEYDLGPGDAVARPAGTGVAHRFSNPFAQTCSVMMLGVQAGPGVEDVVEWPELRRAMIVDADGKRSIRKQ